LVGSEKETKEGKGEKDAILTSIVCRHCGKVGDHWSSKCPFKNSLPSAAEVVKSGSSSGDSKGSAGIII